MDIDAEIFKKVQAGDQKAFFILYSKYQRSLRTYYAKWNVDSDDIEDLIQKTMIKVWQRKDSFDFRHNVSTWIYTIAIRFAINRHRAKTKHIMISVDTIVMRSALERREPAHDASPLLPPVAPMFNTPLTQSLDKAYRNMNKIFQEAFTAHITGATIAEHSAELNVPTGTIKSRRFRAQKELAEGVQNKLWIREFQNKQFV